MNLSILTAAELEDTFQAKTRLSQIYFAKNESSDSTDSDQETEDLFAQYFVDQRLGQKSRTRSLKCGDKKEQSGMRNNVVMKCFDCGSTKHPTFHKECPAHMELIKNRSAILYGVHNHLIKGYKSSELLACLASASGESLEIGDDQNSDSTSEIIEVRFSLN